MKCENHFLFTANKLLTQQFMRVNMEEVDDISYQDEMMIKCEG